MLGPRNTIIFMIISITLTHKSSLCEEYNARALGGTLKLMPFSICIDSSPS